jgi:hypothetical protein
MSLTGLGTNSHCDGEDQQQFGSQSGQLRSSLTSTLRWRERVPPKRKQPCPLLHGANTQDQAQHLQRPTSMIWLYANLSPVKSLMGSRSYTRVGGGTHASKWTAGYFVLAYYKGRQILLRVWENFYPLAKGHCRGSWCTLRTSTIQVFSWSDGRNLLKLQNRLFEPDSLTSWAVLTCFFFILFRHHNKKYRCTIHSLFFTSCFDSLRHPQVFDLFTYNCIGLLVFLHWPMFTYWNIVFLSYALHVLCIGGKINILEGGVILSVILNKKCIWICVLFRTVSETELFHCTVVWIWRPILSFLPVCESVWSVSWPLWLLIVTL